MKIAFDFRKKILVLSKTVFPKKIYLPLLLLDLRKTRVIGEKHKVPVQYRIANYKENQQQFIASYRTIYNPDLDHHMLRITPYLMDTN